MPTSLAGGSLSGHPGQRTSGPADIRASADAAASVSNSFLGQFAPVGRNATAGQASSVENQQETDHFASGTACGIEQKSTASHIAWPAFL